MLKGLLILLMVTQASAADVATRETTELQRAVDAVATPLVGRLWQPAKATYLKGYGEIVTLEVSLEIPRVPFSTPVPASELRMSVAKRRKDLYDKLTAVVTQQVAKMESVDASESLAVIVRISDFNKVDLPDLPDQIVISATKASPDEVSLKEF